MESMTPDDPREPADASAQDEAAASFAAADPPAPTADPPAPTPEPPLPTPDADTPMADPAAPPATDSSGAAPPVGDPTGLGAFALFVAVAGGMAVATAVGLLIVGIGPLLLGASLNSPDALFISAWAALLLTVGAAVLGVKLCNRAKSRLVRIALYVGFALAVLPIGFVNLLLAGSCIASGGDSVSFH